MKPVLLALACLLAACDTSAPDSGIGDLTVRLLPPEATDAYRLIVQTEEVYGTACPLEVESETDSREARVQVTGVALTGICGAVAGPLTAVVPLPASALDGYEIAIRKDGRTDRYRLQRSGDELPLELHAVRATFTRILPL